MKTPYLKLRLEFDFTVAVLGNSPDQIHSEKSEKDRIFSKFGHWFHTRPMMLVKPFKELLLLH